MSSAFTGGVLWYCWCFMILFSFPSFPMSHRVVLLLQSCSTSEFVYSHVCFVYVFIFWIYLLHMRENMWPFLSLAYLTSLNLVSSNCIHLPLNHTVSLFLMAE
jgi:hypothetical protein